MAAIGIDIGGTRARAAIVTQSGEILGWQETAASAFDGAEQLLDWIHQSVSTLHADAQSDSKSISHIGLALPGVLDLEQGTVRRAVNIPWIEGIPIRSQLEDLTSLPVQLTSDADAATWGEYVALQPRPERFVHLRLGTGVALGAVVDGSLAHLVRLREGDGHPDVLVVDDGPGAELCLCGRRGCLEAYVGRVAIRRRMTELRISGDVGDIPRLIDEGHSGAKSIARDAAIRLSSAIANIRAGLSPDLIVVGGGVVASLPGIVIDSQRLDAENADSARGRLRPSTLGDRAGVIGAATAGLFP